MLVYQIDQPRRCFSQKKATKNPRELSKLARVMNPTLVLTLYIRTIVLNYFLHTLPGGQLTERAVVGVEVNAARDTTDRTAGANLPHSPGVVVAGGGTPAAITAAGRPRITGVEAFTIVVGDPGTHARDAGVQERGIAGADVDERAQS